jgi:hypothetical protein
MSREVGTRIDPAARREPVTRQKVCPLNGDMKFVRNGDIKFVRGTGKVDSMMVVPKGILSVTRKESIMPQALPSAVRRAIANRARHRRSASEIALELRLHERTVRRILKQIEERGQSAMHASYEACGVSQTDDFDRLRQRVLALRQQHRLWGAGRLLLELETLSEGVALPSERTLQRWLHQEHCDPAPAGRPGRDSVLRATRPHQVWQVDAAEQKRLGNGQMFSWLRVADECSGAVLKTVVFSRRTFSTSLLACRTARIPRDFQGLGLSRDVSSGQWRSVGIVQRLAAFAFVVVDWPGNRHPLEHAGPASRKWRYRTQPGTRSSLGGAKAMPNAANLAATTQSRRLHPTRTVSGDRRTTPTDGLPRAAQRGTVLQLPLGKSSLGLEPRVGTLERIRRRASSGLLGEDRQLRSQAVRRQTPSRVHGLRAIRSRSNCVDHYRRQGAAVATSPGPIDRLGDSKAPGT